MTDLHIDLAPHFLGKIVPTARPAILHIVAGIPGSGKTYGQLYLHQALRHTLEDHMKGGERLDLVNFVAVDDAMPDDLRKTIMMRALADGHDVVYESTLTDPLAMDFCRDIARDSRYRLCISGLFCDDATAMARVVADSALTGQRVSAQHLAEQQAKFRHLFPHYVALAHVTTLWENASENHLPKLTARYVKGHAVLQDKERLQNFLSEPGNSATTNQAA